jgi:hypothetical protein
MSLAVITFLFIFDFSWNSYNMYDTVYVYRPRVNKAEGVAWVELSWVELSWVELMLWPTVSWPIHLGVGHPFGTHEHIFLFLFFCQTFALLFDLGCPLWREDGLGFVVQSVSGLECAEEWLRNIWSHSYSFWDSDSDGTPCWQGNELR